MRPPDLIALMAALGDLPSRRVSLRPNNRPTVALGAPASASRHVEVDLIGEYTTPAGRQMPATRVRTLDPNKWTRAVAEGRAPSTQGRKEAERRLRQRAKAEAKP